MELPRLEGIEAALAVWRQNSFRAAAHALNSSPSAVSRAVLALEGQVGIRLFHRTTRSLAPTEAGRIFLERADTALALLREAAADAADTPGTLRGALRINASTAALNFVSAPVTAFLGRHPSLRIELVAEDRLADIVSEGFDAGIRLAEAVPQDMIAWPCSPPLRFVVVATPECIARHGEPRTPSDLATRPCIGRRLGNSRLYRWEFEHLGREERVTVSGPLATDHEALMLDAARAGLGFAYVRSWIAEPDLAAGTLQEVLREWTPAHPGFRLFLPGHRHVPRALRMLGAALRDNIGT
ncbi:LysR family transcriptional regulator [Rhizosaccharibacter radicis]|uniref:LysR family transcriptional regulator n=1 Tax=Rhizosaccharibacter radicis TaxID=2782605 RepID=A0ABT1W1G0_9PROT|nr:LysR family transcriptional regulator [Acetobacteraceae bacterium KSS12]